MIDTLLSPALNAGLNTLSAVFLVAGYLFIRQSKISWHRFCMASAFLISVLFLISYLTYHALHGSTRFEGTGWIRPVYFTILTSHSILAAAVPFLASRVLYLALKGRVEAHKKIARITFPIWLYVSVTGVIIYFLLYHG